ncbi:unnamed protein product [Adineta ricciae]|uniref:Uncharacterized protein n=1 Tax=Adineta ricciae TaxID=249248 RepID=A0A813MM01_ADIRI|nr:unnamed protein product [Adineta ricciae]CAF0844354.1 unnamed protein product [Adineta ricciae]
MSVATAGAAVSTQHHQPTAEQIRLAQLIDNKKHNDPEVQKIIRKVLDVVENSNQEDALVALFDCDYDYEKAVALLIEKGHDIANEWRTATNHKVTRKQQQKGAATKNGHEELSENGQQRGSNNSVPRGKTRGGRSRFQQNGGDTHNATTANNNQHQNDNDMPQQRQRGGSGFRGRNRGDPRGSFRGTDRNYQPQQQQQTQDSNVDASSPSDTNRRNKAAASNPKSQQDQWDVGNWNGETLIISRTTKDEEQQVPATADSSSAVHNGQSDVAHPDQSTTKFDFIEAARQIKDVIGIGQAPKSSVPDQQQKSKAAGQPINTKVTPPPSSSSSQPQPTAQTQQRIPHQPVVFSDHFDGGMHKIDVQFGNLGESYDDASAVSTAPFYQPTGSIPTNKVSQQRPVEQSAHISPSTRSIEQPVMNQQRILLTQVQQPAMAMKSVVAPQYTVHPQQHQANTQNMLLQSLLFHQQQQPEPVTLDASYDPNAFPLSSLDFSSPYIMAAMNAAAVPQQQTQARYMVPQPPPAPQQTATKVAQTQPVSTTAPSTGAKKAPAVPPGMFPSTVPPPLPQTAYPTPYGVQQQTGGPAFAAPYDAEHLFTNSFMQLNNSQQTQSPTGGYGSVTPPVQQQNQPQQANSNSDSKSMGYRGPVTENLMLMQQLNLQPTNSQQHGQQAAAHSPMNFFLGHPAGGSNYSSGPQLVYAPAAAAMTQQQPQQFSKQQGQQYNQHNSSAGMGGNEEYYGRGSSSSSKEGQYMYATATQPPHISAQSTAQLHSVNKQQHQSQRTGGNVYNNQQGQQRPYQ